MTEEERERALAEFERLAYWLDERFRLPGTNRRFGLDGLLGLVPGVGDGATALVAAYLVVRAQRLGVPRRVLARMVLNVLVDLGVGAIPLVGDAADFVFKANRRNLRLLRRHFGEQPRQGPRRTGAGAARGSNP